MYGMVNKALEDLIIRQHGEQMWRLVREKAGVDVEAFISTEGYPDEITYNLIAAASSLLSLPAEQILKDFGKHWVLRTATEGYKNLMESSGRSFAEFLDNLPNLHARISLIFHKLRPPRFMTSQRRENSMHLHYYSERQGLVLRESGADHDEFEITWK
jgi:hypothetical protein